MSTFLQLCVKGNREFGKAGTGPTAVTNQTGELLKVVNWIADSWKDLQQKEPNWRWMRRAFTVNTVASTDNYAYGACTDVVAAALIDRFASWWAHDKLAPFNCYLTASGVAAQYKLRYMPYENFKLIYKFGVQSTVTGQPIHISVNDSDEIVLGPKPSAIYTVTGDYQRGPQILAADGDTPDMPSRFHDLIVWNAMIRYAVTAVASEKLAMADSLGSALLSKLELSQLPRMRFGRPLA